MAVHMEEFGRVRDKKGREYYCPLASRQPGHETGGSNPDDCVEASTVGRYASDIHVVDRFRP